MTDTDLYKMRLKLKIERLQARVAELEAQGRSDRHVAMDASANELDLLGRIAALEEQLTTARNDALDEVEGWFVDHNNGTALALFRAMRKNNPPALKTKEPTND